MEYFLAERALILAFCRSGVPPDIEPLTLAGGTPALHSRSDRILELDHALAMGGQEQKMWRSPWTLSMRATLCPLGGEVREMKD